MNSTLLNSLSPEQTVLIAGPTASGKSELALTIAEAQGGVIVNADASQVFECWQALTARPDKTELARAPHLLYGHLPYDAPYSVGHWLRELAPILESERRPIIVGGTGLYFSALTDGLAEIPATPEAVRHHADTLALDTLIKGVSPETLSKLDQKNRARVQRAWEVEHATGKALHLWQTQKTRPLLDINGVAAFVLDAPKEWLTPRIEKRFGLMLDHGALDEARAMQPLYGPGLPSCRAIGVSEVMAMLSGQMTRDEAIQSATIATRQYAKRQRTWFRARMQGWSWVSAAETR